MHGITKLIPGIAGVIATAAVLALTVNALRPNPLPIVRKPQNTKRPYINSAKLAPKSIEKATTVPAPAKPKSVEAPSVTKTIQKKTPVSVQKAAVVEKSTAPQAYFTTLTDAKELYDKSAATFIDARASEDYLAEHITGAVSLYNQDFNALYKDIMQNIPKDRAIVTYCSDSQCTEAAKLADALVAFGYTHVAIMQEGLPGWRGAGYPTQGTEAAE